MAYSVQFTDQSLRDLEALPHKIKLRILEKIYYFFESSQPLSFAKKLKGVKVDLWRFRVGDYRVVFCMDKNGNFCIYVILSVAHRKDIYSGL